MKLTRNEIKIMHIFWRADVPLSRRDIIELNGDKSWRVETIHNLLNSLITKQAIYEYGHIKCGRVWGRLYAARYGVVEYCLELLAPVKDVIDYMSLYRQLLARPDVSIETIEDIQSVMKAHIPASEE